MSYQLTLRSTLYFILPFWILKCGEVPKYQISKCLLRTRLSSNRNLYYHHDGKANNLIQYFIILFNILYILDVTQAWIDVENKNKNGNIQFSPILVRKNWKFDSVCTEIRDWKLNLSLIEKWLRRQRYEKASQRSSYWRESSLRPLLLRNNFRQEWKKQAHKRNW